LFVARAVIRLHYQAKLYLKRKYFASNKKLKNVRAKSSRFKLYTYQVKNVEKKICFFKFVLTPGVPPPTASIHTFAVSDGCDV
jgi:hypothetical protein